VRTTIAVMAVLLVTPHLQAADVAAGKALAARVCAACHGELGVSVADTIPNLGGQRAQYLEIQLKALKSGVRKNGIMNPIAGQLSDRDISNLAAYFSSQAGAGSGTVSDFMPNIAKTNAQFPANHRATFTKYGAANFPELQQVRHYYANPVALQAAKDGKPLPAGSLILEEVFTAKLDERLDLAKGADGIFVANQLLYYAVMARGDGWGRDIPEILRNGDWNYAAFQPDGTPRPRINIAECLACHRAQDEVNYMFTYKLLTGAAAGR
jgi:cytochrome c553